MSDSRYWILDAGNEDNFLNYVSHAARTPLVAIVDEVDGGVIAYASLDQAQSIVQVMNEAEDAA